MADSELISRLNTLNMGSRKSKGKKKAMKDDTNTTGQKSPDEESSMSSVTSIQQESERLYHESLKPPQEELAASTSLPAPSFLKSRQSLSGIITKATSNSTADNIQALYQSQEALKSWGNTLVDDVVYNHNKLGIILDTHGQRLEQIEASLRNTTTKRDLSKLQGELSITQNTFQNGLAELQNNLVKQMSTVVNTVQKMKEAAQIKASETPEKVSGKTAENATTLGEAAIQNSSFSHRRTVFPERQNASLDAPFDRYQRQPTNQKHQQERPQRSRSRSRDSTR